MSDKLKILSSQGRFPSWLHRRLPQSAEMFATDAILEKYRLNTVCEEAKCPNRTECYTKKTATFLALGKECTRNCGFCAIDFSKKPAPPESDEPERIAASIEELGLHHAVITMVARDDLPDQGASHIAAIVHAIRNHTPRTTIELLTSDFSGDWSALDRVLETKPEVFNHNIETVRSLSPRVRHKATYERTLALLRRAKESGKCLHIKSGLMLGLGETAEEVHATLLDLKTAGCSIVTLGQYLQPTRNKLIVKSFVPPEQFAAYADFGKSLGIEHIYAGPWVRSSYNASLFVQPTSFSLSGVVK
ncbi:MAG: lipoyl synthase [Verrucomicrobiota bacterium]|nr:lipoyl synthase [Verrucomicrobiota bacterium]